VRKIRRAGLRENVLCVAVTRTANESVSMLGEPFPNGLLPGRSDNDRGHGRFYVGEMPSSPLWTQTNRNRRRECFAGRLSNFSVSSLAIVRRAKTGHVRAALVRGKLRDDHRRPSEILNTLGGSIVIGRTGE